MRGDGRRAYMAREIPPWVWLENLKEGDDLEGTVQFKQLVKYSGECSSEVLCASVLVKYFV
jgi:hypothetical protein